MSVIYLYVLGCVFFLVSWPCSCVDRQKTLNSDIVKSKILGNICFYSKGVVIVRPVWIQDDPFSVNVCDNCQCQVYTICQRIKCHNIVPLSKCHALQPEMMYWSYLYLSDTLSKCKKSHCFDKYLWFTSVLYGWVPI